MIRFGDTVPYGEAWFEGSMPKRQYVTLCSTCDCTFEIISCAISGTHFPEICSSLLKVFHSYISISIVIAKLSLNYFLYPPSAMEVKHFSFLSLVCLYFFFEWRKEQRGNKRIE